MALVVKDRVKETTATTGTGTLTLAGAVAGFQTFTSVLSNGDTTYYGIFESSTGEFEVGLGTFTSSGTTLARTTILESSNSGSAINLTAGAADVFITQPAEKAVYLDASGHIATADGRNVTNVAASTATTAGTVTTAAQPNITSLGTLTTLTVDDITINGSTISDAGDLTIDVGGDIILDADGDEIFFKDGATNIGKINLTSDNLTLESLVSDKDIVFQGNDGGSGITALTLDMSAAGAATFNSTVTGTSFVLSGGNTLATLETAQDFTAQQTFSAGIDIDNDQYLGWGAGSSRPAIGGNKTSGTMTFFTNGGERARFDSSGNFIVGKTTSTVGTAGTSIESTGRVEINAASTTPLTVSRITDEGDMIGFYEGSTLRGRIGIESNDFFISSTYSGIRFDYNTNRVVPCTTSGAGADGTDDLGDPAARWQNGYFSGQIHADRLVHDGDTNTYIVFGTDQINFYTGGAQRAYINNSDFLVQSALKEDYDALSGTTPTIDVDVGGAFSLTMTGNTTFTFSSCTSGVLAGFVLQLTGNGSTVTYPNTVDFAGGTAPDAPANGETDILVFFTRDGGTTWYGALAIDAAA